MNCHRLEIEWGGKKLSLETGRIARQADGAVWVRYGDSVVLCTAVFEKEARETANFFPLSVHYQEKTFAVGRVPGGFFKREGKPSEKEVLTSRLIDRPIRPLFPESFMNEVQVVCTVMSYDMDADTEIAAIIGASAALALSGAPFSGPIAAARVGMKDGLFVLNPSNIKENVLDLVVAGTQEGVLMVESEAHELSEETMLEAVIWGHKAFQPVIQMILDLKKVAGKTPWTWTMSCQKDLFAALKAFIGKDVRSAYAISSKQDRNVQMDVLKKRAITELSEKFAGISCAFEALQAEILREMVLSEKKRVDGRSLSQIRPIQCDVGLLPKTHGSALFTRGETQALVVATLGTSGDSQIIDGLAGEYKESFLLHYNFPPFSVGEVGRMSGAGRREIGHGKLAWRALHPLLPERSDFPYSLRVVSEITESNGSSSMATVCGATLSLMDAGVPLVRPVAGIAMGLIKDGEQFAVLSDILGDEDFLGDMDFKVAGTSQGITALQMDIKISSVTPEIMKVALAQAKEGRFHILGEMNKALSEPRTEVSSKAPRIVSLKISRDKIRDLIGPGGKVIREICERTQTKIDVDDDGHVTISGQQANLVEEAYEIIFDIGAEAEIGAVYTGTVVRVVDFGAFVEFMGGRDGLVHISELSPMRVAKTTDVVQVGDSVRVKVVGIDDRGKIRLSIKAVSEEHRGTSS